MAASAASPSRGYHLLGPKPRARLAPKATTHETRLLRCLALCTGGLLLLDIWAWVAPGVLAPKGTEHTVADFDTSSLLYLAPLTLHALAALAFFTRQPHPALALWAPALRLRAASLACMALAIPTLVARVVTLQQYCRLEGKVAEKEPAGQGDGSSELFKACASGHVGANAAGMAVAYTVLGVLALQTLGHILALARWQQQQQHHLRAAHARQQQAARARRALSHDGHTPPGGCGGPACGREGDGDDDEEEVVEFWPPEEQQQHDEGEGGLLLYPYYPLPPPPPPPFFALGKQHRQQQRQWQAGGWQPRTPTRHGGSGAASSAGTTSFGSSSLASGASPDRYPHSLHPTRGPTLNNGAASSAYYHPPGVSAAAAATARTLYGDVEQYDDPAPAIMVHHHHHSGHPTGAAAVASPSPLPAPAGAEDEEGGGGGQQQGQGDSPGAYTGVGGPLTLSSGGQASAFSSYVVATGTTD